MSIQIGGWLLALLGLFVVNVEVAAKAYTAEAPLCFADSVLMDTLVANNEIEEENLQNMESFIVMIRQTPHTHLNYQLQRLTIMLTMLCLKKTTYF